MFGDLISGMLNPVHPVEDRWMEQYHVSNLGPLFGVAAQRHLDEGKTLYAAGFTWMPKPGVKLSFESRYHPTAEASNAETLRLLRGMGYTLPRWYQWWRWGEPRPNTNVLNALANKPKIG